MISASRTVQCTGGWYHAARDNPTQSQDRLRGRVCTSTRYRAASRFCSGPTVFCDQILHRGVVERPLGVHPLEPGVLRFQVLDTPQLGGLQAAVLRLPLVVGRNADAGLPADVLDRHAGVGLLEDRDDLGLGETGLLHGTSWLGKTCQKVLLMGC